MARSLGLTEAASADLIVRFRTGRPDATLPADPDQGDGHSPAVSAAAGATLARSGSVVPRQLPAPVAPFAGRGAELGVLDQFLRSALRNPAQATRVAAISGMAGVGKTALALHWAHQVADQFPDGQLYADLRGYDPGGRPADPGGVVREFLHALGIGPERTPATLDGQTALYRSVLAGRRIMVVADNAKNAAQVRPLLPGTPGCVVLVTSRNRLWGLAAAEGARLLNVDVLSEDDAAGLLSARLGHDRVDA
jgi:hypothetical protein